MAAPLLLTPWTPILTRVGHADRLAETHRTGNNETTNANNANKDLNSKTYGLESANGLFWKLLDLAATSANLKELKKSHSKHLFVQAQHPSQQKQPFSHFFFTFKLETNKTFSDKHKTSLAWSQQYSSFGRNQRFSCISFNSWLLVENYLLSRSNGFKKWNNLRKQNDNSLNNISLFPGITESLVAGNHLFASWIPYIPPLYPQEQIDFLGQWNHGRLSKFTPKITQIMLGFQPSPIFWETKGHSCSRIARPPWYCSPQLRWWWW